MNIDRWKNISLILSVDQLREMEIDSTTLINMSELCSDIKNHTPGQLKLYFDEVLKQHLDIVKLSVDSSVNVPAMFRKQIGELPLSRGKVNISNSISVSATYEVRRLIVTELNDYSLVYEDLKSHHDLYKNLSRRLAPEMKYTFMKKAAFSFLFGYYQLPFSANDSVSSIRLNPDELDWISFVTELAVDLFRSEDFPLTDWLVSVYEANLCLPEKEPVMRRGFDSL